ncbi:MAG: hypothetical protein AMXMBFR80_08180 [Dehalococcoidia bacterium]|jgi:3-oxoacid CoA-transferase|nr:3-oxoacid CoA-transferase [Tepidiformaceae bacterium]
MNKVYANAADAVADIGDGASIVFGGFGVPHNWAGSLIQALQRKGSRDLTAIANTLGFGPAAPQILAESRQISRLRASFGGLATRTTAIEEQIKAGLVEFEPIPQGSLVERLRAGGAGLAAIYTPTGVGTVVAEGKEVREFDGRQFVLESAIRPDFALIRASRADTLGNLVYHGSARNFHPIMAMSARCTIVEVDEIVEPGALNPDDVITPGIFVDRIIKTEIPPASLHALLRAMGRDPFSSRKPAQESGSDGLTRDLIALRVAKEVQSLNYVNLGIGMPTMVSNYLDLDGPPQLHAENGVLGYGPFAAEGEEDWDVYNAGGQMVTMRPGGAFFHSVDAFTMARGGRLDAVVLGAFQVSEQGDLANWWSPHMGAGGIGGAMDLAVGAKRVIAMMEHTSKTGEPKLMKACTYPLTAPRCVTTVVTDLAVIDVVDGRFRLRERAPGVTVDRIRAATDAELVCPDHVPEMDL